MVPWHCRAAILPRQKGNFAGIPPFHYQNIQPRRTVPYRGLCCPVTIARAAVQQSMHRLVQLVKVWELEALRTALLHPDILLMLLPKGERRVIF